MKYKVYKITNKTNGKIYIGYTKKTLDKRWKQHVALSVSGKGNYIHKVINKHGKDNFEMVEVTSVSSKKKALELEKYWIKQLNSFGVGGYNLVDGTKTI